MIVETMSRADMECEILMSSILPCNTAADLAALSAMSDDEMRDAIRAWVAAGDECAAS